MNGLRQLSGAVLVAGLIVAACTSGGGSSGAYGATGAYGASGSSPAAPASAAAAAGPVTIGTATTSLGTVLTGPNGLTLYTHAGDGPNSSTCTGGCAAAWPPVTVGAGTQPVAGAGVTGALGTFTRDDGTTQVTYGGLPLYSWPADAKPGDVTGQGVGGFVVATVAGGTASPSSSGGHSY
jgi:predicted lipoprotein with Yx(FWY)xxD motif